MKKVIVLLSVALLTVIACSKSDDAVPIVSNPTIQTSLLLPKKISYVYSGDNGSSSLICNYDGNKILEAKSEGSTSKEMFTYDGDLIIKNEFFQLNNIDFTKNYIYENNQLKTVLILKNLRDRLGVPYVYKTKKEYTYNSNGTILEENFKFVDNIAVNSKNDILYTFTNGNLVKKVENLRTISYNNEQVDQIFTSIYEFDDKMNPYKNILGIKIIFDNASVNNVVKETTQLTEFINGVSNINYPLYIVNYNLEYNSNNYLRKSMVISSTDTNLPGTIIKEFFYE